MTPFIPNSEQDSAPQLVPCVVDVLSVSSVRRSKIQPRRRVFTAWLGGVLSAAAFLLPWTGPLYAQDSTNSDSATDFNSFQIISQRNIFDPTRSGRLVSLGEGRRRPPAQTFMFCGVGDASLDKKGYAAMFDGYGNPGGQLYVGDVINGFKIAQIPPPSPSNGWRAAVLLATTNSPPKTLFVGMGMRREEGGPWTVTDQPEPMAAPLTASSDTAPKTSDSDSSSSSTANSSSAESDVIKRLKAQREQEDK